MRESTLKAAARELSQARLAGQRLEELAAELKPDSEAEAYQLQAQLHRLLVEAGHGQVTGYKIGCTTEVMQRYLKIPNPCAGGIFESTVFHEQAAVNHADYLHVGVECEVAVRLGQALGAQHLADEVRLMQSIESVMAAIEIVDDRWRDYARISTPTLIADDFFGAGCVLGGPVGLANLPDLGVLKGEMRINGEFVGAGSGRDILGHPLNALKWLAQTAAARDLPLQAGEFVLLGSLVQTVWVVRGDEVRVEIEGLESVSLRFD